MKIEEKLSQMIQIETVSEIGKDNAEKFERFQAKLKELFPAVFGAVEFNSFDGALLLRFRSQEISQKDASGGAVLSIQRGPFALYLKHVSV